MLIYKKKMKPDPQKPRYDWMTSTIKNRPRLTVPVRMEEPRSAVPGGWRNAHFEFEFQNLCAQATFILADFLLAQSKFKIQTSFSLKLLTWKPSHLLLIFVFNWCNHVSMWYVLINWIIFTENKQLTLSLFRCSRLIYICEYMWFLYCCLMIPCWYWSIAGTYCIKHHCIIVVEFHIFQNHMHMLLLFIR